MLRLTFEIKLMSDYHIGAGHGKGFGIDSALLTEASRNGTPVLRGSTLVGLLKDASRRLLNLPPLSKQNSEADMLKSEGAVLHRIFGSPKQMKRWSISSGYPEKMLAEVQKVVQRVRIDPLARRAEDKKLFTQEEGKAEHVFVFEATCQHNDPPAVDEASFIVAAARFTRQFGRSRRRGLGECIIHLKNVCGIDNANKPQHLTWEDYLLEHFNQSWLKNNLQEPTLTAIKTDVENVPSPSGEDKVRLKLIIRLDEPLLISTRASAGNWFDTRPIIPGTTIRGAMAALAATRCNLGNRNDYKDFIMLFLREGITFPVLYPAYLLESHIYPTIPSVMGLVTCNIEPFGDGEGHGVYKAWELNKCAVLDCGNERMETIGDFLVLKKLKPHTFSPGQSSEMHVRIDPLSQRAVKGDLYGYNLLNAGQFYLGEMNCADEDAWKRFQKMTGIQEKKELPLRIGKARQRGYGKATAWVERQEKEPHVFIQTLLRDRIPTLKEKDFLTLTLLTDTIITNQWGQQADGFSVEWLEKTLDMGCLEIEYAHATTRMIDGFNTTLGLPRWRDTALAAGSMVRFSLTKISPDWEKKLERLETKGIGARRNEGFGQIAFNHPAYEMCIDITSSAIDISELIQQIQKPEGLADYEQWENRLLNELHFTKSMSKKKDDKKYGKFYTDLARWLYEQSDTLIDELIPQLNLSVLGKPQQQLIDAIGGKEEYGERDTGNFFEDESCKKCIEEICLVLSSLEKLDRSFHRRGKVHLANHIAGLFAKKEVDRQ